MLQHIYYIAHTHTRAHLSMHLWTICCLLWQLHCGHSVTAATVPVKPIKWRAQKHATVFFLTSPVCLVVFGEMPRREWKSERERDKLLLSVYLLSLGFVIILKAQLVHVTTFAAVAQRLPLLENINKAKRATRRAPPFPGACLEQCTVGRG